MNKLHYAEGKWKDILIELGSLYVCVYDRRTLCLIACISKKHYSLRCEMDYDASLISHYRKMKLSL